MKAGAPIVGACESPGTSRCWSAGGWSGATPRTVPDADGGEATLLGGHGSAGAADGRGMWLTVAAVTGLRLGLQQVRQVRQRRDADVGVEAAQRGDRAAGGLARVDAGL